MRFQEGIKAENREKILWQFFCDKFLSFGNVIFNTLKWVGLMKRIFSEILV